MSLKSLEQVLEVFLVIDRFTKSIYYRYRYSLAYDTIYVHISTVPTVDGGTSNDCLF